jgi:threonine/homoserine/homoserine lactone efflux protein
MGFELWLAFVMAAFIILIIPGPTIILVISQALSHGRRSVVPLACGVACGDFTAMTLSLLGLGALLSTSAFLFSVFKWLGALYLVYLGISLWRSDPACNRWRLAEQPGSGRPLLRKAFVVTAMNPKSIAFFVAFLPQFLKTDQPVAPQIVILVMTFVTLAGINAAGYALFAARLRDAIANWHVRRWLNRCGGSTLIAAGILTASMRQRH